MVTYHTWSPKTEVTLLRFVLRIVYRRNFGSLEAGTRRCANKANRILGRQGRFWQEDYFDSLVRSDWQFAFYVRYVLENPVKAALCKHWDDWPWSGCQEQIRRWLSEATSGGQDVRAPSPALPDQSESEYVQTPEGACPVHGFISQPIGGPAGGWTGALSSICLGSFSNRSICQIAKVSCAR